VDEPEHSGICCAKPGPLTSWSAQCRPHRCAVGCRNRWEGPSQSFQKDPLQVPAKDCRDWGSAIEGRARCQDHGGRTAITLVRGVLRSSPLALPCHSARRHGRPTGVVCRCTYVGDRTRDPGRPWCMRSIAWHGRCPLRSLGHHRRQHLSDRRYRKSSGPSLIGPPRAREKDELDRLLPETSFLGETNQIWMDNKL
jgi:hypothetical protein